MCSHKKIKGSRGWFNIYRPQCSCGKVMFSQACVKNSVGGVYPSMHWDRHSLPSAWWDTHTPLPSAWWDTHTPLPSAWWDTQKQSYEIDCNSWIISSSLYFLFSCLDKYINSSIRSITRNTSVTEKFNAEPYEIGWKCIQNQHF